MLSVLTLFLNPGFMQECLQDLMPGLPYSDLFPYYGLFLYHGSFRYTGLFPYLVI